MTNVTGNLNVTGSLNIEGYDAFVVATQDALTKANVALQQATARVSTLEATVANLQQRINLLEQQAPPVEPPPVEPPPVEPPPVEPPPVEPPPVEPPPVEPPPIIEPGSPTLLFEDLFATWDQSKWTSPYAWNQRERVSNGELQYYADDAITTVNNNLLRITATPWKSPVAGANYKSGCITTFPRTTGTGFRGRYFYAEARMRLPAGKGVWPAFWTLADGRTGPSTEGTFPHPPEIDIMEALGDSITTWRIHLHADKVPGSNKDDGRVGQNITVPDMSAAFHTYAVDWKPDKCRFYFDDVLKWEVATPAHVNLFDHYLILNLAVGGWAGTPVAASFPARFDINWVRVWDRKP